MTALEWENKQLRERLNLLIDTACPECQRRERKALERIRRERPADPQPPGEIKVVKGPGTPFGHYPALVPPNTV